MRLKRFEAPTLQQALSRVEAECGKDALLVESRATARGFAVVASLPSDDDSLPVRTIPRPSAARPNRATRRFTRGFTEFADRAREFGLRDGVLLAIERALSETGGLHLDRPGDPAVPRIASRVLEALIPTIEIPSADVTAFVGPTGVGKTTTLAKLAAHAAQDRGESVAIVTIDTYRMAAVEQIRAMAELLDATFEVAFTPSELRRTVAQLTADHDRVLVDTTGRSPFDIDALRSLHGMLHPTRAHVVLCIAAATRHTDVRATYDGYRVVRPDSLILTKWDETAQPGEPLSFAIEQGVPISHITLGQEIPEDIVAADASAIAANVFAQDEAEMEALL